MGSALRGAFGYALKKVVCINPSYQCQGCFAQQNCLYYDFYEAQNSYHSYRFETTLGSELFDFSLFVFSSNSDKLAYIISSIHKMLTQVGLGGSKLTFDTFEIFLNAKPIYAKGLFEPLESRPKEFTPTKSPNKNITLDLITPLRIKKNNRFLRDSVELNDILRSIHQRERQIYHKEPYAKLDYTPSYQIISSSLYHKKIIRKSNRQKSKMNMDGIMGIIQIQNLDPKSYNLLKLGEILGVGKQTVMGLGSVRVLY